MYDRVLVITINSYCSKVPSTSTAVLFWYRPVPRFYFSKVPSTDITVLLRSTLPTTDNFYKPVNVPKKIKDTATDKNSAIRIIPTLAIVKAVYDVTNIII